MSKKNKNKIKKSSSDGIKILKSGKVKLAKGQKFLLTPYVEESLNNSVVSRLDAIISKEDVVVEHTHTPIINSIWSSSITTIKFLTKVNQQTGHGNDIETLVVMTDPKNAMNLFSFEKDTAVGSLLRTSTLASVFRDLADKWDMLNDVDSSGGSFTNVLFIPKIFIFAEERSDGKAKLLEKPVLINLLVVSTPLKDDMSNGIEEVSDSAAALRVTMDTLESCIKLGIKNIVVSPFEQRYLSVNISDTPDLWKDVISQVRILDNFDNINFAIEDEDDYIVFQRGIRDRAASCFISE